MSWISLEGQGFQLTLSESELIVQVDVDKNITTVCPVQGVIWW